MADKVDIGRLLYAAWCEVVRAGPYDPPLFDDLPPLERDAWRTAANRLRRGFVDEVVRAIS